jgi:carboxymethylenebutenolidase
MQEQDVIVTTKYGRMPTFAVCPEAPGQYPGIIFYMDAPGTREELRNMARRIARHGYFCLLPDMYYRLGHLRFDVQRRDDSMMPCILAAMSSLTNAKVMDDTGGLIGWLDGQDKAKPGPLGCVGYCMSGMHITNAAAFYPHRIASAARSMGLVSSPTRKIRRTSSSTGSRASSITPSPRPTAACRRTSRAT